MIKRAPADIDILLARAGDKTQEKLMPSFNPWEEMDLNKGREQEGNSGLLADEGAFSRKQKKAIELEMLRRLLQ